MQQNGLFREWKCPENLLELKNPMLLNKSLGAFVTETLKMNSDPYPPKTLHEILCGLLRHAWSEDLSFPCKSPRQKWRKVHKITQCKDTVSQKLRTDGVGSIMQSAELFTKKQEEAKLWESGALGTQDHTSLLRAVLFYMYKWKELLFYGGMKNTKTWKFLS